MALRLHWPDERYARIYCRDTIDWNALSWDAQALWMQLNRKTTRAGRIDLGRIGRRGVAALLGRVEMSEQIDAALDELLADGCVVLEGTALAIPDFVEAQEAVSSGAARQRAYRERKAEKAAPAGDETSRPRDDTSRGDETSQKVTSGYCRARKEGTERPCGSEGIPAGSGAKRDGHGARDAAPIGDDMSRSFAEDLEQEATRAEQRAGPTLRSIGHDWTPVYTLADRLHRRAGDVEADLLELRRQGLVERAERGTPPVWHWRRAGVGAPARGP